MEGLRGWMPTIGRGWVDRNGCGVSTHQGTRATVGHDVDVEPVANVLDVRRDGGIRSDPFSIHSRHELGLREIPRRLRVPQRQGQRSYRQLGALREIRDVLPMARTPGHELGEAFVLHLSKRSAAQSWQLPLICVAYCCLPCSVIRTQRFVHRFWGLRVCDPHQPAGTLCSLRHPTTALHKLQRPSTNLYNFQLLPMTHHSVRGG